MKIKIDKDILKLVNPTMEYKEQVMNYRRVFLENNESFDGCSGLEECETYEEWIDFDNRLSKKYGKGYTTSTVYLAIRSSDNKLVGIIDFRHRLSEFLLNYGGNIGYSVLPEERRKGYAKEMLRLVLEKWMSLFEESYVIELETSLEKRLKRNKTANRLEYKASKRDIKWSENELLKSMEKHKLNSAPGEGENIFKNYLKIVNTDISAIDVAKMIKEKFNL